MTPDGRLRLWAHGDHPGAARLAESFGMTRTRTLWQLRRSLFAPARPSRAPRGRHRPDLPCPAPDDDAWLALNAKAFADHPEQGAWDLDDLHQRMAESWFDPARLLPRRARRRRTDRLVGFHWTKVHGGTTGATHAHEHSHPADATTPTATSTPTSTTRTADAHGHAPIGEVYVVGVDAGRARQRPRPGPDPHRPHAPPGPGPARRDALRRRGQHRRRPPLRGPRLRPLVHRRHVRHLDPRGPPTRERGRAPRRGLPSASRLPRSGPAVDGQAGWLAGGGGVGGRPWMGLAGGRAQRGRMAGRPPTPRPRPPVFPRSRRAGRRAQARTHMRMITREGRLAACAHAHGWGACAHDHERGAGGPRPSRSRRSPGDVKMTT